MSSKTALLIAAGVLLVWSVAAGSATPNYRRLLMNYPAADGEENPCVVLLMAYYGDASKTPMKRCSGTIIGRRHILTAGHCTGGAPFMGAIFASDADAWLRAQGKTWPPAWEDCDARMTIDLQASCSKPLVRDASGTRTCFCGTLKDGTVECNWKFPSGMMANGCFHPCYNGMGVNDFAVMVVDEDLPPALAHCWIGDTAMKLPAEGAVDAWVASTNQPMTVAVGYGIQLKYDPETDVTGPNQPSYLHFRQRTTPMIINLQSSMTAGQKLMTVSQNAMTGGPCFGDSGGPFFQQDTPYSHTILGLSVMAKTAKCNAPSFAARLDSDFDTDWVKCVAGMPVSPPQDDLKGDACCVAWFKSKYGACPWGDWATHP